MKLLELVVDEFEKIYYLSEQRPYGEPEKLKAGVYSYSPQGLTDPSDKLIWQYDKLAIGKNVISNNEYYERISKEVSTLISKRDWFKKLGSACRRGILLYGPAGTGKTTIQKEVINALITNFNAIVIQSDPHADPSGALYWVDRYRKLHKDEDRPVVFSFSDLNADDLIGSSLTYFRNFLESHTSNPTIVFATTNEFERLDPSLSNRPGRFDSRILIESLAFPAFEAMCEHYYLKAYAKDIYAVNPLTTPALLKEISTRIHCFDKSPLEAINSTFDEFSNDPVVTKNFAKKAVGKKIQKLTELLAEPAKEPAYIPVDKADPAPWATSKLPDDFFKD